MAERLKPPRDEGGQAALSVVLTLVATLLVGALVYRVAWTATSINQKAGNIAATAAPINVATDAVAEGALDKTNELAGSILETAKPLQGKLAEIIRLAKAVDELAVSINNTASDVDETATGINSTATGIVDTARSIDRGVAVIITNLNTTIGLAQAIKGDTGNILTQARRAHQSAACIDQGLRGSTPDGHCG